MDKNELCESCGNPVDDISFEKCSDHHSKGLGESKQNGSSSNSDPMSSLTSSQQMREAQIRNELNSRDQNIQELTRMLSTNMDIASLNEIREKIENEKKLLNRAVKDSILNKIEK